MKAPRKPALRRPKAKRTLTEADVEHLLRAMQERFITSSPASR